MPDDKNPAATPDQPDVFLHGDELRGRFDADQKRYLDAADQLGDRGELPTSAPRFDPEPPRDHASDESENQERQPVAEADPEAEENRKHVVAYIVAALILLSAVAAGVMLTRANSGNSSRTQYLELTSAPALSGPIVISDVSCYVPPYDPSGFEIDAGAKVGGTSVLLTALSNGSALGLPANLTYFDIHIDRTKPASDPSGWVSNKGIATFNDHTSVTIDGPLLSGTVAAGGGVGRIDSTTLTCPH